MKKSESPAIKKSGKVANSIVSDGWQIVKRAAISGTLGGLATAIAASVTGKYENDSFAAPLNATSHIIWGDKAAQQDRFSLKYTFAGFLLNHVSGIFWAIFYEKLFGLRTANQKQNIPSPSDAANASLIKPLLGAAAVTTAAYIIDYHLIPSRFTPGFEKRISGKSLTAILAALAIGLAARDVLKAHADKARIDPAAITNHK